MAQHPNPSAPKPSAVPTAPGPELAQAVDDERARRAARILEPLDPTPLSSRAEPAELSAVVKFIVPVIVGGYQTSECENKPKSLWSFSLDWPRRVVWVQRELANGQYAQP